MMKFKIIFLYCFCLQIVSGQNHRIDSLHKVLINSNDTTRINTLITIGRLHFHGNPDSALIYLKEALESAEDLNYKRALKEVNVSYSVYYFLKNNFDKSIDFAKKVLIIKGPVFTAEFDGDAYTLLANGYLRKNMSDKSLSYYHLAAGVYENLKLEGKIAMVENNIGNIFYEQNRYKEAITYYSKSIEKRIHIGVEKELITPYNNLGNCFNALHDYKKALQYQEKALALSIKTNNLFNVASCYQDIGAIYFGMDDLKKSREYKQKALNIFRNTDYLVEATSCYLGIGEIYAEEKNYKTALTYIDSARIIADSTDFTFNRHLVYKSLSGIYKLMGNYKEALEYSEMTAAFQDSLVNEDNNKTLTEMQTKYESEKKDIEILVQKAEAEKQHTQRNGFIAGSVLLLFLLVFILRGYRQKQKASSIISQQKEIIEEKNKGMTDSINYAKKIQQAHLPTEKYIEKSLERLKK